MNERRPSPPATGSPVCRRIATLGLLAYLLAPTMAQALNVGFLAVLKSQRFQQLGRDLVALTDRGNEAELAFEALAFGTAPDAVISAEVQVPGGPSMPMPRQDPNQPEWSCEEGWDTPLELDSARPAGSYTVNLATNTTSPSQPLNSTFVRVTPATQNDVPRNSAIAFRFSRAMNPAVNPVSWTGIDPANITCT